MEKNIRIEKNIIRISYWVAFCPLYKRKIFKNDTVRKVFEDKLNIICQQEHLKLNSINYKDDYCVYFNIVDFHGEISIRSIIAKIKKSTSSIIRREINSNRTALWTRNYLALTNDVMSYELLEKFLSMQKSNPLD